MPIRLQNTIKIKITCTRYFKDFKLLYSLSSCLETCYFSSLWYIHTHKCPCIILWNNLIRSTIPGYPGAQISRFPLSKSLILHYWLHDSEQMILPSWVHNANSLSPPFCIPLLHSRLSVSLRPENQRLFILIFVIVEQGQHKPYSFFGEVEFHFPLLAGEGQYYFQQLVCSYHFSSSSQWQGRSHWWLFTVKPALHTWNKSDLVVVCNLFYALLDLLC